MADPPPEVAAGHPQAAGEPLQPPQAAGEPRQPLQPVFAEAGLSGDPLVHPQHPMESPRPPLAVLNHNGEQPSGKLASSKKQPQNRPSMGAPLPKIKKKKSVIKLRPYHLLSNEEVLQQKMKEVIVEGRENLDPRELYSFGVGELNSRAGLAEVVQPLQSVDAMEFQHDEGGEETCSEEDEDDDFDLDAYQADDQKRAELSSLMERYNVYDEEQLRLAIRREQKQRKILQFSDAAPAPSSESAPVSPNGAMSRFIPPLVHESSPRSPIISPDLNLTETAPFMDGKSAYFPSSPPTNLPPSIPMQTSLQHVTPIDVDTYMSNTHSPHAAADPPPPVGSTTPLDNCHLANKPTPMQSLAVNPTSMQPLATKPTPMQPIANPMQSISIPMHTPTRPDLAAHNPTLVTNSPSPLSQPVTLTGPIHAHPNTLSAISALEVPGRSNPLPNDNTLTDFPPLSKGPMVHDNGSNGDITMAPVDEGKPRPPGGPSHVTSPPPIEQASRSALAPAPRPPTSLAERVKNSAPPTAPVAFNPTKYTPIGAKGDREGTPVISFSKTDTECLAGRVGLAVVGKFSHSIPSSHNINKALNNIPIRGTLTWNFLNAKHVLIMLSDVVDYAKLLHGVNGMPVWYVESVPMRVFKWTPEFDPSFETPIVAVWCNLPALPIHLYDQRALYMICSSLGNPIQVDHATAARSRITYARVCVEIDITKPPVEEFVIDMAGVEVRQKVVWDKIPRYCSDCKHVGHLPESCYAFGRNARPDKKAAPQARAPGPRAKGVPRDPPSAPGAPVSPAPVKAPQASSGSGQRAHASGDRPVHPQPRSPSRGQGISGGSGPHYVTAGAAVSSKSPRAVSSSGLRPLRMGERHMRSSSQSPPRVPLAPGARGAPSSPPRAPKVSGAPVVSGVRGDPRPSSRGHNAPVASGAPLRRPSSPRSSPGRASHDASLGEWIDVAQKKHKTSTYDDVANVPTKNAYVVLNDGTELLEAEYESEDDRDIEMTDGNKDVASGSVQGSSTPNRGRVLPDSFGGNLRSGVTAPASS